MSELVTDYMERALPLRIRLDVWWHLVRCEACRRYFDQMRHTVRLLGSSSLGKPPDPAVEQAVLNAARVGRQRES